MELSTLQLVVLATCITALLAQLPVKHKQISHILFAVFCASIALTVTKKVAGDTIGAYQYLIGMLACATCNCYWLFARTLFREKQAIAMQHVLVAAVIALLIMLNQGYLFVIHHWQVSAESLSLGKVMLSEATQMLSSCILVLTFWEGCRGFKGATRVQKQQRLLFLSTFASAVIITKVTRGTAENSLIHTEWVIALITLMVLTSSQILLFWKTKVENQPSTQQLEQAQPKPNSTLETKPISAEFSQSQIDAVTQLLIQQEWFLQPNLKVGDLAKALDLPEYKISKIIRNELNAPNFNHFVNQLRIEHAKRLLLDPEKHQWPVLVVGLESGFASVGPFSRAFKNFTGSTPNQYRQKHCIEAMSYH